jgi:Rrf2 family protein
MDRLLNISDRTNAALHALALAAHAGVPVTAAAAAARLGVSPSYLAKALQPLARAGRLSSARGVTGGFTLARRPGRITALEVLELLDGPLPRRDCLFEACVCPAGRCRLKTLAGRVSAAARAARERTTVADLARSFARQAPRARGPAGHRAPGRRSRGAPRAASTRPLGTASARPTGRRKPIATADSD